MALNPRKQGQTQTKKTKPPQAYRVRPAVPPPVAAPSKPSLLLRLLRRG